MQHTGTVIVFKPKEGWGFVRPDSGGPDHFVHFSQIQMDGYKELFPGDRVRYEVGKGPSGRPHAEKVEVISKKEQR